MRKVILITGASSGIGLATLQHLSTKDRYIVYGSIRSKSDEKNIIASGATPILMEMSDYESLERAVQKIIATEGRIDVLFNNAGYGLYGSVEETPIEEAKKQFDVNLFGLAKLTQVVLPHMRDAGAGLIINTSSMGGKIYTPLGAWYHASKHALEGWSDCLRLELKQFNIDVAIIEPGGIQTGWGSIAADNIEKITQSGAYKSFGAKTAQNLRNLYEAEGRLSPPSIIARCVEQAIEAKTPKTRYVAGKYARPLMFIRKYLGDRMFDRVIMRP